MNFDEFETTMLKQNRIQDHKYIHLSAYNDGSTPMVLSLSYNRDDDFLENANDYKVSISKMSIDTYGCLPMCLPKMLIGVDEIGNQNIDVNKLAYSFTMQYYVDETHIYEIRKFVEFIPENSTAAPTSYTYQDTSTDYYYIYSYEYMMKLLNNTLSACYTSLNSSVSGGISSYPPFFSMADNLLIFQGDKSKYDISLTPRISIYMNNEMMSLLNGFKLIKSNLGNGKDYQLYTYNDGTNILSLDSYDALTILQNYSSLSCWNPIQGIALTTNSIPIYSQLMSPLQIQSPKELYNTNNKQTLQILTYFDIDLTSAPTSYLPQISYGTGNNYRFIDMMNAHSFNTIDISIWWMDHYQRLHKMFLSPQGKAFVDLVFINKKYIIN